MSQLLPKSECQPALQLVRHQAVMWILICLLRGGPSPRVLGGTLALSLNPRRPMSHKCQRVNMEKRKISFHTAHREANTWCSNVSFPVRWELSKATHRLLSLPTVSPTSGLLQMTGIPQNLQKAEGNGSACLRSSQKYTIYT